MTRMQTRKRWARVRYLCRTAEAQRWGWWITGMSKSRADTRRVLEDRRGAGRARAVLHANQTQATNPQG